MLKKLMVFLVLLLLGGYLITEPLYTPTALTLPMSQAIFPRLIVAQDPSLSGEEIAQSIEIICASEIEGMEIAICFSKDNDPVVKKETPPDETTDKQESTKASFNSKGLFLNGKQDAFSYPLEKIFQQIGSQKYIFLNIQTEDGFNMLAIQKVVDLIHRYHLQETVIVSSSNPLFLISMRLKARDILLMYEMGKGRTNLKKSQELKIVSTLVQSSFFQKQMRRLIRPDLLWVADIKNRGSLKNLIQHGYPVICGPVKTLDQAQSLLNAGVKGIITSHPFELLSLTANKPQVIYDSGGSHTQVDKIVYITGVNDIQKALLEAKTTHKTITIAGRRHSMGGHTFLKKSLHLNMLGMNEVFYNPVTQTVTAEAGATWKKIQTILDQHGRCVKVMQSDNIFSVGGSISANVHGWQVGMPPLSSTLVSLKMVTADGELRTITPLLHPELFRAVVGGYGQLGVIYEAELETLPNSALTFHARYMPPQQFSHQFEKYVSTNPNAELAYGRLCVDQNHLFEEAGLFWYEKTGASAEGKLDPEPLIAIKRAVFRSSQYFEWGKKVRWLTEKFYAQKLMEKKIISRNNAMNTDIHILWPLYGQDKDILQEYFIPKQDLASFLNALKQLVLKNKMNVLNVTIREVRKDTLSYLAYAKEDVFGVVILFSQRQTPEAEKQMQEFTQAVIDAALSFRGSFYLPYRLHYQKSQLIQAYPLLNKWIKIKEAWDPDFLFNSEFYRYIKCMN